MAYCDFLIVCILDALDIIITNPHIVSCTTLLEAKLDDQGTHVTPANLITTLRNMNVTNMHDVEYMALYNGSKALDALSELTSLDLDLCRILNCRVEDIILYIPSDKDQPL